MSDSSGITPADIESKFRDIADQVDDVAESSKKKAIFGGGALAVVLLLLIYIMGRKTGKKKSTVLEIRRM